MPGHQIVQLRLIFRVVPPPRHSHNSCTNMFLTYVQHFNIVPQPNAQCPSQKGSYVESSAGMYCLKQACHIDGSFLGDVIALEHIRALVDLIPHFGEAAEKCLSKETVLEHVVSISILRKNFLCSTLT